MAPAVPSSGEFAGALCNTQRIVGTPSVVLDLFVGVEYDSRIPYIRTKALVTAFISVREIDVSHHPHYNI